MQTAMTIVEELKVQVDKDRVDLLGVAGVEREC
jgi:hypothetical protein